MKKRLLRFTLHLMKIKKDFFTVHYLSCWNCSPLNSELTDEQLQEFDKFKRKAAVLAMDFVTSWISA
jgi:hypothetical protein